MSTLTGKTPQQTYKDLLQVSNNNQGIDSVSRQVSDGEGTTSPLQLSITKVQTKGSGAVFEVANSSGTVLFEVDTTLNTITAKSGVSFEGDGSGLTGVLSTGVGGASATVDLEMLADSDDNGSGDLIFKIGTKEVGRIPNTYAQSLPVGVAGQYFLLPTGWASPNVGAKYDGSTQYSQAVDDNNLSFEDNVFSFEFFFKEKESISNTSPIISKFTSGSNAEYAAGFNQIGGFYVMLLDAGASNYTVYTVANVNDTKIKSIIFTYDGSAKFYLDGMLESHTSSNTGSGFSGFTNGGAPVYIASRAAYSEYFPGDIYKVKFYNYALSQSDVDARWNNGDPMGFVEPFETRSASNIELLTNGDFTGGTTDWILQTGFTYGTNNVHCATTTVNALYQSSGTLKLKVGRYYKATVVISNYVSGGITVGDKSLNGATTLNSNGTHIVYYYAASDYFTIYGESGVTSDLDIESISLVEVGNVADWDFTNGGVTGVIDGSLNGNHLQHVNSPIVLNSEIRRDVKITITGDTTLTDVIPASHKLRSIVVEETAGGTVTMNIGSTAAGTDIVNGASITASGITNIETNYVGSLTAATSMFISSSAWGTASVDLILQLEKI